MPLEISPSDFCLTKLNFRISQTKNNLCMGLAARQALLEQIQHTATHCNTLQHTHCNTLRRPVDVRLGAPPMSRFTATATHCNTLQHTATHCNTLHHTATHCNNLWMGGWQLCPWALLEQSMVWHLVTKALSHVYRQIQGSFAECTGLFYRICRALLQDIQGCFAENNGLFCGI